MRNLVVLLLAGAGLAGAEYGKVPLHFEAVVGGFQARGAGYAFQISGAAAVMESRGARIGMRLVGARQGATAAALEPLVGRVNYLIGSDPKAWRLGLPTFGKVKVSQVRPGVDLVYYGNQRQLEYDLVVAAGVDPGPLEMEFDGVNGMRVASDGGLILETSVGEFRWRRPEVYQVLAGKRVAVDSRYELRAGGKRAGFVLGSFSRSAGLTIDPTFEYSRVLGGTEEATAIKVDASGQAYVTGRSNGDVFVTKLDSNGNVTLFSTYIGGTGDDQGTGLAIDSSFVPNVYVTGRTSSTNFPVVGGVQSKLGGDYDAFVMKLNGDGQVQFASYQGGSGYDSGQDIAVNSFDGSVFIAGSTDSSDFPVANAMQAAKAGGTDGFVTRFSAAGSVRIFSTYLGGSGTDQLFGLKVNAAGQAWVAGRTNATGEFDCLVAGLSFDGSSKVYSTTLGGSAYDGCTAIDLTPEGNLMVTGGTDSADFPLKSPTQAVDGGARDIFVTELGPTSGIIFSTFLGGPRNETGNGVAMDVAGVIHLAGDSTGELPLLNPVSPLKTGSPGVMLRSPSLAAAFSQILADFGQEALLTAAGFQSSVRAYVGSEAGRIYRSDDGGSSWLATGSVSGAVRGLAYSGASGVLAGTANGAYFSADSGASWAARYAGPVNAVAVNPANNAFYLALPSGGVLRSTNQGSSWLAVNAGLTHLKVNSLALDANNPNLLLAGTDGGLFRSTNGGDTWVAFGLTTAIQQVTYSIDLGMVFALSGGKVMVSTDAGLTWTARGLPISDGLARLAVHPFDTKHLLVNTASNGVWRSLDRGVIWNLISTADTTGTDVVFNPGRDGSSIATFSVNTDAVLARWGRIRSGSTYSYYAASVTYAGTYLPDSGKAVAADANTIGTYMAGSSGGAALVTKFGPSPVSCNYQVTQVEDGPPPSIEGGTGAFRVLAPSGCAWTATSGASWLSFNGSTARTGASEVRYFIRANTGATNRTALLTVAGKQFSVEQPGGTCSTGATLTNYQSSFFAQGGTTAATLGIAAGCAWSAESTVDWITFPVRSGTGPATVTMQVAAHSGAVARSATVRVGPVTFTVDQAGACFVSLSPLAAALPAAGGTGQLALSTGAGCTWSLTSSHSFLSIISASGGIGPATVIYSAPPNTTAVSRSATISGAMVPVVVTQPGTTLAPPAVSAPSPSFGSGVIQTFSFTFSDANGVADLDVLNVLFSSALDGRNACYIAYVRSSNITYLVPDSGEGLQTTPNSQCGINSTTATVTGNVLKLDLSITFGVPFSGNKIIYQAARDLAGNNTGWIQLGVWNVPSSALTDPSDPTVTGMSPARSTGDQGTFTFTAFDPNGATDIDILNILVGSALDARNACYLAYVRASNTLYLVPDSGTGLLPLGVLENSQCRVPPGGTAVFGNGNLLTFTVQLEFKASGGKERIFFVAARDRAENNSGWQAMGTISLP